ncbi:MAG TPA: hypothetical protein PK760_00715 [Flavobacteriales bacterium]|nr:hypothetical protein [Flavobacteriales bacterium]
MRKHLLVLLPFLFCSIHSNGQRWAELMHDGEDNIHVVKQAIDEAWEERP